MLLVVSRDAVVGIRAIFYVRGCTRPWTGAYYSLLEAKQYANITGMALLITTENKPVFVTAEQAKLLWLISTGERKGDAKARAKVKKIAKFYLNPGNAPKSWLDRHPPIIEKRIKKNIPMLPLPYKD